MLWLSLLKGKNLWWCYVFPIEQQEKNEREELETPPDNSHVSGCLSVWSFMGLQALSTQKANLSTLSRLRASLLISDPVTEASGRNYELSIFSC